MGGQIRLKRRSLQAMMPSSICNIMCCASNIHLSRKAKIGYVRMAKKGVTPEPAHTPQLTPWRSLISVYALTNRFTLISTSHRIFNSSQNNRPSRSQPPFLIHSIITNCNWCVPEAATSSDPRINMAFLVDGVFHILANKPL